MRQWMVDPKILCQKHLLGEHVEHHMFIGTIRKGIRIDGYLQNNLLEPKMLYTRHTQLVREMQRRGMNHKSPLSQRECIMCVNSLNEDQQSWKIKVEEALLDLIGRCPDCRKRMKELEVKDGTVENFKS